MRTRRSRLAAWVAAVLLVPLALSPAPAAAQAPDATVTYVETGNWGTGYGGQITIANAGSTALTDWTIEFDLPPGTAITSLWDAVLTRSGDSYTLTPPSWGAAVPAGGTYGIGFNGTSAAGNDTTPLNCTLNGAPCSGEPGEPDTEPPSAPGGLTVTGTTATTVGLSWDAATDDVGVAGYEVLSGGEVVRAVTGTAATVTGLSPETAYSFTVRAYDTSNNRGPETGAVTATTGGGGTAPAPQDRRVAYFTQWGIYDRGYLVKNLDTSGSAESLTHINYSFGNVNADGQCFMANQLGQGDAWADYGRSFTAGESVDGVGDVWSQDLRGNFNQLRELKEKYPHLKVNISLGGWTWSEHFSDAALTPQSRERMVSSCIDQYLRGNLPLFDGAGGVGSAYGVFDGIDLDWEWPASEGHEHNTVRPEDRENFTALVQEFRDQLDALEAETSREFELTAFLPADPDKIDLGFEMDALMPNFDFITVQGYDYHGAWEDVTNHQSNLLVTPGDPGPRIFAAEVSIDRYLELGVDPADMVLGVPFYSRGWTGVAPGPDGDGLFQSATGPAPGSYEAGIEDWKVVKNLTGFDLHRDDDSGTAWLYDGSTFWTYDDEVSIARKTQWALDRGLGGVMIWSIDGDDANGTLMDAIDATLG